MKNKFKSLISHDFEKKIYTIFSICFLTIISNTAYADGFGWLPQSSGTNWYLNSVSCYDANTAWIVGGHGTPSDNGIILRTNDGGFNWKSIILGIYSFNGCYFVDNNTGWIVGNSGVIYKTTNGGINWTNQPSPTSLYLTCVHFLNSNTGWISGNLGLILYTSNGGTTWETRTTSTDQALRCVFFIDANTGWAAGSFSGSVIIKTINGGANWENLNSGATSALSAIQFIDNNTGWCVGSFNTILKTTNSGSNWISMISSSLNTLYDVEFANSNTGWVVGSIGANNLIMNTTNGGSNWTDQMNSSLGGLYSVDFINNNTGWTCGYLGRLFHTTTGGFLLGVHSVSGEIPVEFSLKQNYPNPFNPSTKINYSIPKSQFTILKIYDELGNEVATLVNQQQSAGSYEVDFNGSSLPSGVYFYKLQSENFSETKRMTLIK